jgi:hypothetical protein
VLRPEQREDRELEVIRRPPEQAADAPELSVGETERSMERLFGDLRQVPHSNGGAGRASRTCGGPLPALGTNRSTIGTISVQPRVPITGIVDAEGGGKAAPP